MGFTLRAAVPKLGCFIISALLSPKLPSLVLCPEPVTGSVPTLSPVEPQRTQLVTCRLSVQFGFDFLWGREGGVGGAEAGESQAVSHNTNSLSGAPCPFCVGRE